MLGSQPIVEIDRQVTGLSELHPELTERDRASERPSTAVQVDHDRMSIRPLGNRDIGTQAGAQLDILFESANCWKILIVGDRQIFPSAALLGNAAARIPARRSVQNLTIVFADHASCFPFCATLPPVTNAVLSLRQSTTR